MGTHKSKTALPVILFCVIFPVLSIAGNTDSYSFRDRLADSGLELNFGVTNIYQANVKGGTSTNSRRGRHSGSYDLELSADMHKLLGIQGGRLYVHAEGSWPKTGGIDPVSVQSAFGVNGDASERRSIDVTELWYEQAFADDKFRLRLGKMDITGGFVCSGCSIAFDKSAYANDETTQFLNSALVNNPTIPFPDYALGIAALFSPAPACYISAAVVDAQNDFRETGFNTAFHDEDYYFYVLETGITPQLNSTKGPLPGAYRIGLWNDPRPKANSDQTQRRDDTGFYLSFDQMISKENSDAADMQGLGTFFRYGYASSKRNDITNFVSAGLQYQGLIEGRDNDLTGLGFAQGFFANSASETFTEDYETVFELYYNAHIFDWLNISPSIQYIANPGGVKTASDAVVLALRAQMTF